MFARYIRRLLAVAGVSMGLATVTGCLVATDSKTTTSGVRVSESTYDQIKPGTTTIGWVHATLGEPNSKTETGKDEVWKYTYTERTDSNGAVLLIFAGSNTTEKSGTVYIEFNNGVVVNKWRA
jgi:outer membrane protein assembly factor BamE (lipoprotein component of BamABCDE complex)